MTTCKHGSLERSCPVCELERELAEARRERDEANRLLALALPELDWLVGAKSDTPLGGRCDTLRKAIRAALAPARPPLSPEERESRRPVHPAVAIDAIHGKKP